MQYEIKEEKKFKYIDEGEGEVMVLLHGLFGALSNFVGVVEHFSKSYRVIIPFLPLYTLPLYDSNLSGMLKYFTRFVKFKKLDNIHILGNSLGGHLGLLYTLKKPDIVKTLSLTGSSGLFEDTLGGSFPKRGNYEYIKERTQHTFFDPKSASKELVDEVFEIVNNRHKAIRIISMARSAMKKNLSKDLNKIKCPVFLIWGNNDTITPPYVAKEFERLLPNAHLELVNECGHAPMMEKPEEFNNVWKKMLSQLNQ